MEILSSDSFKQVWDRFLQEPVTLGPDPDVREKWHRGRSRYAVWLLRVRHQPILDRMLECRKLFQDVCEFQPIEDAHLTVFVSGFPTTQPCYEDDVHHHQIERQFEAMKDCISKPIELKVGGLNSFLISPFLEVEDPAEALALLRSSLAHYSEEIRFAPYLPHVTIGNFKGVFQTKKLALKMEAMRHLPSISFCPEALELVEFDVTPGARLETRYKVPMPLVK